MEKRKYSGNFKLNCVKQILKGQYSLNYLSKIRDIPKSTLHKWINLYSIYGSAFIVPKKRGPKEKNISVQFEKLIKTLWHEHKIGSQKLLYLTKEVGFDVSERQIQKILNRNNLKMNNRSRPSQIKYCKYERSKPDELWHTDWSECPFTGKKLIAFIDDHSRYLIHAEFFSNATAENSILAFENAILKNGIPKQILTDNGSHFTNTHNRGDPNHIFTQFCVLQGVKHILGRPSHPETNGKIERWFGTYKKEFDERFNNIEDFIKFYNEKRIHQSLDYKVPAERYIDGFKRSPIMS